MALEYVEDWEGLGRPERRERGEELAALLKRVRWRKSQLADAIGCNEKTIRQMTLGVRNIPHEVVKYLRLLDRFHEKHPAPRDSEWREKDEMYPEIVQQRNLMRRAA
jgi:hypothetical protein